MNILIFCKSFLHSTQHTDFNILCSIKCIMKKMIPMPNIPFPISFCTFTVFDHQTKPFFYPPFNWCRHIWMDPIYLTYSWIYMAVYSSYSVGQTHLSSFLLKESAFFNTRLLFSPKGIQLFTLRTVKLSFPVYKNDHSCIFRYLHIPEIVDVPIIGFSGNLNRK